MAEFIPVIEAGANSVPNRIGTVPFPSAETRDASRLAPEPRRTIAKSIEFGAREA
jgi:hypothetical protein